VLDQLIALKRQQYSKTGARDYFADAAHVQFLHRLLERDSLDFGGVLSALYAGDDLVAAHFGLRAGPVLHWWFPVYDPKFSRLDPGWMLLRGVIEGSTEFGLTRIDLGRGSDEWKRRAATGHDTVCQGVVVRNPLRRRTTALRRGLVDGLKASPAAPALRRALYYARRRGK
jgi:CelD/BcsL family acetyltransferase involved in cellulose biosynthesis